ncbi:hypothetical protein J7K86_01330 [bacterium]|nr:hypothetical protein [bacterium]
MKKWFAIITLALFVFGIFMLVYAYLSLKRIKVKEEKIYILKNCSCEDYLKFRKQYKIGILIDEKNNLCNLKCK